MIFDGGRRLLNSAFAYAAIIITSYKRGENLIASDLQAKPAKTVFSQDSIYISNNNLRFSQIDFLIRAADFPSDDFAPEIGDVLTDDKGTIYEVTSPSGEPCWRWHTPEVLRIHCMREYK